MGIKISAIADANIEKVWSAWTSPEHIKIWNTASDDWHTTKAEVDLTIGGNFSSRMEAKDGSFGFDFTGTYTNIIEYKLIEYTLEDGRTVSIEFVPLDTGVKIVEIFDPEQQNTLALQEQGWQAILDSFVRYVASL